MDLDDDGSGNLPFLYFYIMNIQKGAIGVEELEEPLIALGLVSGRQEVVTMMSKVDEDN